MINSWFPPDNLVLFPIQDIFNDNIDYTINDFRDLLRLNQEMYRVSSKFRHFLDCSKQEVIKSLEQFLSNFQMIQTFLREIDFSLKDTPAQSSTLILEEKLNQLKKSIEETNQQHILTSAFPQYSLKEAKEKILLKFPNSSLKQAINKQRMKYTGTILDGNWGPLLEWISPSKVIPQLIYKASIDGFDVLNFHQLCDSKGPTLIIIKSTEGWIFGGYTSIPWKSPVDSETRPDPDAFIFSLVNPNQIPPTKYPSPGGVVHNIFAGPYFAGSIWTHNLQHVNLEGTRAFTGGTYSCLAQELEVFSIEQPSSKEECIEQQ